MVVDPRHRHRLHHRRTRCGGRVILEATSMPLAGSWHGPVGRPHHRLPRPPSATSRLRVLLDPGDRLRDASIPSASGHCQTARLHARVRPGRTGRRPAALTGSQTVPSRPAPPDQRAPLCRRSSPSCPRPPLAPRSCCEHWDRCLAATAILDMLDGTGHPRAFRSCPSWCFCADVARALAQRVTALDARAEAETQGTVAGARCLRTTAPWSRWRRKP